MYNFTLEYKIKVNVNNIDDSEDTIVVASKS